MEELRRLSQRLARFDIGKLIAIAWLYKQELAMHSITIEGDRLVVSGPIFEGELKVKDRKFLEVIRDLIPG